MNEHDLSRINQDKAPTMTQFMKMKKNEQQKMLANYLIPYTKSQSKEEYQRKWKQFMNNEKEKQNNIDDAFDPKVCSFLFCLNIFCWQVVFF